MPFTPEERRARSAACSRAYRKANKATIAAKAKEKREQNKDAIAAYQKAYRATHKAEKRAKAIAYQAAHPGLVAAQRHGTYLRHKDTYAARKRAHYVANKTTIAIYQRLWSQANRAKINARVRTKYARNPVLRAQSRAKNRTHYANNHEMHLAKGRQRRASLRHAPINDLTAQQWREIQAAQEHCCAYCGKRCKGRLTQDHIIPLSKGGSHTLSNVVGACSTCNCQKFTGPPPVPVQPLLLTIAPRKKKKSS